MKTRYKIYFAKIILKIINFFKIDTNQICTRNEINWNLNLNEGIDLSIYIFGNFEKELLKMTNNLSYLKIKNFIDIGANIGVHTLQFAKNHQDTKIYSIEPTDFAFEKLKNNLKINENLRKKIQIFQYFFGKKPLPSKLYSSWSLLNNKKSHTFHKGILKSTLNGKSIKLDDFTKTHKITNNTLIKCDVDGHELTVFESGENFLKKYKPHIFMELAPYLYPENGYREEDLFNFFLDLKYEFYNFTNYKKIANIFEYSKNIQIGSSKNIFLK